jgi:hypothetical protein
MPSVAVRAYRRAEQGGNRTRDGRGDPGSDGGISGWPCVRFHSCAHGVVADLISTGRVQTAEQVAQCPPPT